MVVFFFKDFIIFREGKEKKHSKERETLMWESNMDRLLLVHALIGDQTHNLGMGPDQESNRWPFALQNDTQPTEPHLPGSVHVDINNWLNE